MGILSILSALLPVVIHGATRVIDRFTGGAAPANAQEVIQERQEDNRQLEAISKLDDASGASQWVTNIRGLQRPVATAIILTTWSLLVLNNSISVDTVQDLARSAIFYLFGDRTTMYVLGKIGKK